MIQVSLIVQHKMTGRQWIISLKWCGK